MSNRIEFEKLGRVELTEEFVYGFELFWLRRPAADKVDGDLGRKISEVRVRTSVRLEGDFRLIKTRDFDGLPRLRIYSGSSTSPIKIQVFPALPPDPKDPLLGEMLGVTAVRNGIYREIARMVEDDYTRLVEADIDGNPLLDYSFRENALGLEAWMCAMEGNFTRATVDAAERRRDILSEINVRRNVQIHMPFLRRRETRNPAATLENCRVERSHYYEITVGRDRDEPVEHHLTVAALAGRIRPSNHHFSEWMHAPGPKSNRYKEVYHSIAGAVQMTLRQKLPAVWEHSTKRPFHQLEAFSLAVYRDSPPWSGRTRTDFSYDVLCPASMNSLLRSTRSRTSRQALDAVRQRPRFLHCILAAERHMIDSLINLGIRCEEISSLQATDPAEAARQISKFAGPWAKSFRSHFKRVLPGLDCSTLADSILSVATDALHDRLWPNDFLNAIFFAA